MLTAVNSRKALRAAIAASGKTQERVAEELHKSPVTVSRWLNGGQDPSFAMLDELAQVVQQPLVLTFGPDQPAAAPGWARALADETAARIIEALSDPSQTAALVEAIAQLEAMLPPHAEASDDRTAEPDPAAPGQ